MKSIFVLFLILATAATAQPQWQPHVIWDRSGITDSSAYGYKILPLGDQNNDDINDWAVYAQGNGGGYHGTRASYLEFFHGGTSLPLEPYFTFREDSLIYHQLWYSTGVGDLNGDGFQDWMVSFWPLTSPNYSIEGIFWGGHDPSNTPDMEWIVPNGTGLYPLANFYGEGHGDFNGDGFDDLFEYDFFNDVARIYYGGNPMDTIPDWILNVPPSGINQTIPYAVGDFNGDGASDFMCFNPNNDTVAIFLGGIEPDTVPAYIWGNMTHWPLGGVRDLTGDGSDEFLFEALNVVDVHLGGINLSSTPNVMIHFSCSYTEQAVSAGDFNHDGYQDLIMLNDQCDDNMFGSLTIHLGHPWLNPLPVITIDGWTDPLNLIGIYTAAGLGDVNGDGIDDIAIGAWDDFAYLGWRGRCVILSGDDSLEVSAGDSPPELPRSLVMDIYPNPFNSEANIDLEVPLSPESVTLTIFNVLGQEVQHQVLPPFSGEYTYHYNAQDLPSGLYFLHAQSGSLQTTQKLMLLK